MIRGGIADKLGNRYEAKWLVRNLFEVINCKADWLKFESVEPAYRGFEFAVGRGKITEWHQTKVSCSLGNWTINALEKAGVLKAFSDRLSAGQNEHCFFISQDKAKDFSTLIDKANGTNHPQEFSTILSQTQKGAKNPHRV